MATTRKKESKLPRERACAVTRKVLPESQLLRFVADGGDQVVPDIQRQLPGRGVWVSANKRMVGQAVERNVFSRSLKRKVTVAQDLPQLVEQLLIRQVLSRISLARKAGMALAGYDKVLAAVEKGVAYMVCHASDAAPDGVRKLEGLCTLACRNGRDAVKSASILLNRYELGSVFGREQAVHVVILKGNMAQSIDLLLERLVNYNV